MKYPTPLFKILCVLSLVMIPALRADAQVESDPEETILVGRISHIHGQLLRYDGETGDWVTTVEDAPFGVDDLLLTAVGGRAEMIMPNNTWVRIDGDTQIQLIALSEEITEVDLASGKARLYNKSSGARLKATTPFGHVTAPSQTAFDCYVGETDVEVIAHEGTVHFVHNTEGSRHEVIAGSTALSADIARVTASEGSHPLGWDGWNGERDRLWADRMQAKGQSADYLPPGLHDEAYVLEKYGRWERVYYDGAYYPFWRPLHISVGWAPFTVGRWYRWCGDHVWLPHEPFGYLTHHYGNWIFTGGYWYWAPPVPRLRFYAGPPLLNIGFCWYPGRVGWLYSGAHVGWIPLAPCEPYYGYRRWGRYSHALASHRHWHRKVHHYRHRRHAVIIHRNHFYRSTPYHRSRIRGISHDTVLHRYRTAPRIHRALEKNYRRAMQNRPRFNRAHARGRPNLLFAERNQETRWARGERPGVSRVNSERRGTSRTIRGRRLERMERHKPEARGAEIRRSRDNTPRSEPRIQEKRPRKNRRDRRDVIRAADRRKGPEIVRQRRARVDNRRAKVIDIPDNRNRRFEDRVQRAGKKQRGSRLRVRSEGRSGPEIVRPRRERAKNRKAKVIELQNHGRNRFEAATQRARQMQQTPRLRDRSQRRKGPEIVRPQRMRSENRNAKVLEIQNRQIRRSEVPTQRLRQERPRPRLRDRSERRMAKIDRPVMQRQRDTSSMRTPNRARSEWRGRRDSFSSSPRGHERRQASRHARAERGNRRFGR